VSERGNGRIFQRNGSSYWWIAFYAHGKEQREVARHPRTSNKLDATEDNRPLAERFLKRRLGEVIAERHGGPSFVGPTQQRLTVSELLDSLKADF
jgi:hypothetical protein